MKHVARESIRCVSAIALLMLMAARPSAAQNVGTVAGVVTDPQGLTIPAATVTLVNRVSQTMLETVAGDTGRYTFENVPYGTYVLAASFSGFTPVERVVDVRSTVPIIRPQDCDASPRTIAPPAVARRRDCISGAALLGQAILTLHGATT